MVLPTSSHRHSPPPQDGDPPLPFVIGAVCAAVGLGMTVAAPSSPLAWLILALGLSASAHQGIRWRHPAWLRRLPPEARYHVDWDRQGVRSRHPDRDDESVKWTDVVRVAVVTTVRAAGRPHCYVLLHDRAGLGASFPVDAPGVDALLSHLIALPDFDRARYDDARSSETEDVFSCWVGNGLPAWGAGPLGSYTGNPE